MYIIILDMQVYIKFYKLENGNYIQQYVIYNFKTYTYIYKSTDIMCVIEYLVKVTISNNGLLYSKTSKRFIAQKQLNKIASSQLYQNIQNFVYFTYYYIPTIAQNIQQPNVFNKIYILHKYTQVYIINLCINKIYTEKQNNFYIPMGYIQSI